MKKLLMLAAIFALIFTACPTDDEKKIKSTTLKIKNESSKTINDVLWNNVSFKDGNSGESDAISGTWAGSYNATTKHSAGEIEFDIIRWYGFATAAGHTGRWSLFYKDSDGGSGVANGLLKQNISTITLENGGTVSLSGNKLILSISGSTGNPDLSSRVGDIYELTRVGDPFISGTNVTKDVEAGSGYIFFKVGATAYRTKNLVVVEKDKEAEFTFNDYTLVVNVISSDNTVTLGSL